MDDDKEMANREQTVFRCGVMILSCPLRLQRTDHRTATNAVSPVPMLGAPPFHVHWGQRRLVRADTKRLYADRSRPHRCDRRDGLLR